MGRKTIEAVLLSGERDYTQSSENDFVEFQSQEGSIRSATPTLRYVEQAKTPLIESDEFV